MVFVPFLGDFLSIQTLLSLSRWTVEKFSSPFLGTFFQYDDQCEETANVLYAFSSPFLGTFFQLFMVKCILSGVSSRFRPLSWGLSFNTGD